MARQEADREDLFQDATAYLIRGELIDQRESELVFLGWRPNHSLSIYFGADPVYQFDERSRLRRAYFQGSLYRSQGITLSQLNRVRNDGATTLLSRELNSEQLNLFLEVMLCKMQQLLTKIQHRDFRIGRASIPADDFRQQAVLSLQHVLANTGELSPKLVHR